MTFPPKLKSSSPYLSSLFFINAQIALSLLEVGHERGGSA